MLGESTLLIPNINLKKVFKYLENDDHTLNPCAWLIVLRNRDIVLEPKKIEISGSAAFVDEVGIRLTYKKLAGGQPDGGMDQPYLQMSSAHDGLWEDTGQSRSDY